MVKEFGSEKSLVSQRRTRDAIWAALLTLLEETPFEQISVQQICDRASLHRTTFYNHFFDVYDLVAYGTQRITETLIPGDVADFTDPAVPGSIAQFVTGYRAALLNLQKTSFVKDLLDATDKLFEESILNAITNSRDTYVADLPAELMATFIRAGLKESLMVWLNSPERDNDDIKAQVHGIVAFITRSCIGVTAR